MFEIKQIKIQASESSETGSNGPLIVNQWVKTALDAKDDLANNGYKKSERVEAKDSRMLQLSSCISSNIVMKMKG